MTVSAPHDTHQPRTHTQWATWAENTRAAVIESASTKREEVNSSHAAVAADLRATITSAEHQRAAKILLTGDPHVREQATAAGLRAHRNLRDNHTLPVIEVTCEPAEHDDADSIDPLAAILTFLEDRNPTWGRTGVWRHLETRLRQLGTRALIVHDVHTIRTVGNTGARLNNLMDSLQLALILTRATELRATSEAERGDIALLRARARHHDLRGHPDPLPPRQPSAAILGT